MRLRFALLLFAAELAPAPAFAWGTDGHEAIVRLAWRRLADPCLSGFFTTHLSTVLVESMAPDRWRDSDPNEAPRHYLNIDAEPNPADYPHAFADGVMRYGEGAATQQGLVPWRTEQWAAVLRERFEQRDAPGAAAVAGQLGHYVGDAHSPLHATRNYDGQLTGNPGMHDRFESRFPRTFRRELEDAAAASPRALPAPDAVEGVFAALLSGVALVPEIVRVDTATGGGARSYYDALRDAVRDRWADAAALVASLWIDAWLRAGRPALAGMPASCAARADAGPPPNAAVDAGASPLPPGIPIVDPAAARRLGPVQGGGGCAAAPGSAAGAVALVALGALVAVRRRSRAGSGPSEAPAERPNGSERLL
jgi:MYXO-CTERM domain-containing protein